MKKYLFIFLIVTLIIFTSIIKTTTRELETKIFNSEEKIKILTAKKELILLQNHYLTSPQKLFKLKEKLFGNKFKVLELKQLKYLNYNEKKWL